MDAKTQEKVGTEWLYARGWTIVEAAEYLGVNQCHLGRVLKGERISKRLLDKVVRLPRKNLNLKRSKKQSESTHENDR